MVEDPSISLPGRLADKPKFTVWDMLRGRRQGMPWSVPDAAYVEPYVRQKSFIGDIWFIGDPGLARQVLVDRAANYPKAPIELKLFSALFGRGLLGIEGDLWRAHRRTMAPAFDPRSVAAYAPAMADSAQAFIARWSNLEDGAVVDVSDDMSGLTLTIIARTMFSGDGEEAEPLIRDLLRGAPQFSDVNIFDFLPLTRSMRMRARAERMAKLFRPLDEAISRMIARRRGVKGAPNDLLTRLLAATEPETGLGLTDEEVRDELITIFIAGHETTATAMTWIWMLLAAHPAERARVQAELDAVLGGRTAAQDDLARLPLTRRFVDEALRLYPPAPGMSARVAAEADELAGESVPKGAFMVIAPWVLQRHRKVWEDPERFEPDRWRPELSEGRPRLAAMPFGAGPRVCIGQRLAENELMLILATLAQHYELDLASDAPIRLRHNVTLRPEGGLPMRIRRRRVASAVAAE